MTTVSELAVLFSLTPSGWDKGNSLVKSLAGAARRYLGVEAVRSVVDFVEHTTEAATHLISFSNAMGLTTEKTQEWGYVAEQSGSNLRELAVGFGMAERNLRNFAAGRGGKALNATMAEIGTSTDDAKKALASPDGMNAWLLKTSDSFQKMGNNAHRGALGQAVFGARAGRAVVADMSRGSEAIQDLMKRRREMGELTTEQATTMRDLGNRIKDVKTSVGALGTTIVAEMAPTLLAMADSAVKWISANKEIISGAFAAALKVVAGLFSAIGAVISTIGDLIHRAMGGDDGATAILIGLAAAIISVVVPALWAMAAPIIAAMLPFIAIAAVVALIAYGILKLIKYGPQIRAALGDAWDWITQKGRDFVDWVEGLPGRLYDILADVGNSIINAFVVAWDAVKQATDDAVHYIGAKIEEIPIFGLLPKAARILGEKAAQYTLGNQTPDVDATGVASPSVNVPSQGPGGGGSGGGQNVTVHQEINITGVKNADDAAAKFDQSMRHANYDAGGR